MVMGILPSTIGERFLCVPGPLRARLKDFAAPDGSDDPHKSAADQ